MVRLEPSKMVVLELLRRLKSFDIKPKRRTSKASLVNLLEKALRVDVKKKDEVKSGKKRLPKDGTIVDLGGPGSVPSLVMGADGEKITRDKGVDSNVYVDTIRESGHTPSQLHCAMSDGTTMHIDRDRFSKKVQEEY